ncbi:MULTISPECIES: ABC transporter ATP-binding protein [Curtobacterium]|jgi:ATP-binding cassette subfamily B protein|uniref:ABC transporter ATP-binding protein/permease n=2 Tax=Curtobacterium TaxID=2034 RepID=A0A5P8YV60_9MICO|nr:MULTISPECIES: ABC transporter ATP-binding protein [Curtobacterium]MBB1195314.1 ABC transporter ATP-binding protein [Curtobacterium flaccumfaciens]MBO9043037.1 ABC transporter ATP-binding protein [Curtobacterium flaccumfaciens pv. flaccumfaciens]MBO9046392.1 ABC transporter ATP-binding protein [Curtobacterium flaccumfaciens pv. flaccumfaciens]MBO9052335.1 ABC transporter ATP-binding protein [Curtobacterium flaccumfaciens pv. flaccumfaciens]MBO9055872.1 ABC transporter ATP-binding protein [Cu
MSKSPTTARPSTFRAIARIYPYVKPYQGRLIGGMAAAMGASLVALAIPYVLQWLVDGPLSSRDSAQIWPAGLGVLALGVLEAFFIASRRRLVMRPSTRIETSMRNSLYAKLQDLPVAFHDRWESGQLLSRSVSDLSLIRRWLAFGVVLLVVNIVTIVVGFVVLFTFGWILGLIFLIASIPLWINGLLFERRYSAVARRSQDQVGDLATSVEQSVHGIRVLKAFGRGGAKLEEFSEQAEALRGTEIKKAKAIAGIWLWLLLVPDVAFALCLLAGIWLASQGQLSVGQLFAFFATATVLRFPIESIGFLLSMTFDTRTAVDRFFEVMDSENTITDPEHPKTIAEPHGALSFNGVHFRYQDSAPQYPDLINGVELQLQPGETMALVGLTGCGKTTLLSLVPRLYDVTGGSVTIDGVDIRDLTREELRRHVGVAFEDATLFSSTVRENVLLGRPDVQGAEAEALMREALDIAQASFVDDLPDGVDTRVGEEGLSLSGGQRQRLALARAIAARPSVLVLDDPLSALDVDTEARVEAGLRRVLADTTSLIVAHRPSTVTLADRVALMENGVVTAVGTHHDLMATNEHYRYVISSLDDDDATARQEAMA